MLVALCLLALFFGVWPVYRHSRRLTPLLAAIFAFIVVLSVSLYNYIGNPGVPSGAGTTPDTAAMVTSLAAKLEDNPDNVNGWKMLARSYKTLQQFDAAMNAYERAMEIEGGQNAQTLVELALVIVDRDGGAVSTQAEALLETALALDPNDPNSLFYSGMAAARRGDTDLAADRWEILLGLNAPPEIRDLVRQKISEWRGEPSQDVTKPVEQPGSVVLVSLSLSAAARAAISGDATVYIIARDPAQPGPPIAVARRRMSELPMVVELGDRDAMIPGRSLSGFAQFELLARISVSGNPVAESGDWFGALIFRSGDDKAIDLVIDQQTP